MAILIEPPQNELSALQNLSDGAGFLKKMGDGNYLIDNNNYLPLSGGNLTGTLGIKERSAISARAINSEISLGSNGTGYGIFNRINITNEVLTTNRISYGNFNQIQSSGQNSSSFSLALYGAWNDAITTASGGSSSSTLNVLYGAFNRALHQSSDTIFKHVATTFGAYNISQTSGSTATITTAVGSFNYVLNNNATSTITTAHGTQSVITANPAGSLISTGYLFRGEYGGSGTITNRYGLYIDDLCTSYLLNLQVGGSVSGGGGTAGLGVGTPATGTGNIDASGSVKASFFSVGSNQVVSARRTGWTTPTGTASRATFATSTVTVSQLAERVKALIDDLVAHGLIGT